MIFISYHCCKDYIEKVGKIVGTVNDLHRTQAPGNTRVLNKLVSHSLEPEDRGLGYTMGCLRKRGCWGSILGFGLLVGNCSGRVLG